MSLRIILADDHKIMREGLRTLLEKQDDFLIIAEAGNGRTTVKLAEEHNPDLVVMDTVMPDLNGIEATRQIIARNPKIKIIALSMHSDKQFVMQMLKAGASGYILKDCAFKELVYAIQSVVDGYIYLSPRINTILLKERVFEHKEVNASAFAALSNREREVLQLIAEGRSTKEIAETLFVSVKTIETHRQQIMSKLNIHSIAGLTKYAIREGLTTAEE
ncbi:MAG: response regulator transcription factor [Nitrospirae bacterium]|nr:response regulator transcription factor [Nitrospirota bacterium]